MHKLYILIISIVFFSCNNTKKSTKTSKQEIAPKENIIVKDNDVDNFIPDGYEVVFSGNESNKIKADLNTDGILDYVILIANGNKKEKYSNATSVKLAIFEGQKDGSFILKNETGNLTYSFIYTNPDVRVKVTDTNIISIKHQSMRHDYELKFRYQNSYEDYMLIGAEYNNYGNAAHVGAGNTSTNFIFGKRTSTIDGNKTSNLDKLLTPISEVNDDNIYDLISN
ncbi:hypothetical protein QWY81_09110 [Polaribacter undariae]|uniref:Uncharacterized protein n=1 Tax=Polaribacter sejongensis TaxID=985043 RepID=A0AAJ1QX53_9FLAO|nr:hypothetical protein [Polaribacter undariae]MDN3619610.1 hypothetical protein [Polaribacter undariae]UWD32276.1 hypothetical protein NQP51_01100 [Polaribacter undariae]